jgi:hypothetical protein
MPYNSQNRKNRGFKVSITKNQGLYSITLIIFETFIETSLKLIETYGLHS